MFLEIKNDYPTRNNNIQIPRLLHSLQAQNNLYTAPAVYRKLPPELLQPDGVSVALYVKAEGDRVVALDQPGGCGSTNK